MTVKSNLTSEQQQSIEFIVKDAVNTATAKEAELVRDECIERLRNMGYSDIAEELRINLDVPF